MFRCCNTRQSAHRIARTLRTGSTERLRFPFQLTALPTGLRPASTQFEEGGPLWPWRATLDVRTQPDQQAPAFQVVAYPRTQPDSRNATTTIDGHPAHRETFGGDHLGTPEYSDRLYLFGLGGLNVDIYIDTATAAEATALWPDGVLSIYRTLAVHPDPQWTGQPVR